MSISAIFDEETVKQFTGLLLVETWEDVEGTNNNEEGLNTNTLVINRTRIPESRTPDRIPRIYDRKENDFFSLLIF